MNVQNWGQFLLGIILVGIVIIWVVLFGVIFIAMSETFGMLGILLSITIFLLGAPLVFAGGIHFIRKGLKEQVG